ncbi:hypothetical protein F5Y12DRAFT_34612 [Xylaria sp. FL1777]|nr:hypothetical protein F5Y12DRAFT_34612 [Xylaria sp. FL1777]
MERNSEKTVQTDESGTTDTRPESSPYASPLVKLHFADGPPLPVAHRLIEKSPKLIACCKYDMTLHLAHISSDVGHVLVHYLYTGTYECLKPRGSFYEKDVAEFTIGVWVYAVAGDYGLPGLKSLARGEIEKLGNRLQVTQVLDILSDILPNPSIDDIWLQSYLKSLVRPLIIDNPPTSLGSLSGSAGKTLSIAHTLLKAVIELGSEKTNSLSSSLKDLSISQDRHDEPAAADVETGPTINLEHNPANVHEHAPTNEDSDATFKKKKKCKKCRRKEDKMAKLSCNDMLRKQSSGYEGKEQGKAQDQDGNSVLTTTSIEVSTDSKVPQPESLSGGTFGQKTMRILLLV